MGSQFHIKEEGIWLILYISYDCESREKNIIKKKLYKNFHYIDILALSKSL